MAKVALLIGVSEYQHGLPPLPAAVRDADTLQRVLQDRELGEFDEVKVLLNPEPQTMQYEIETLFSRCTRSDLVLLYFSGHGIKDDRGNLYFATRVTQKNANGDLVRSSAVSARFVHEILENSRAKRQAIILDCCFSGAFDPALRLKDDGSADVPGQLGAEGRVVLTSSSSTQYSLEQSGSDLSLYTRYLVEGIETAAGDLNGDGYISIQELHHYASDRVRATAPDMTPKIICLKDLGFEIILSKAKVTDPQLRYRKVVTKFMDGDRIRPAGRAVLDTLKQQLGLTQAEADHIEAEVFRPYRERMSNLQKYRDTLLAEVKHEYPLSQEAHDALTMLRQLLGLREEDVASVVQETAKEFFNQGWEKNRAGDQQGAVADFDGAIRLDPDFVTAYFVRGVVKANLGNQQEAITDFDEAIRLNPNLAEFYNIRGLAKANLGNQQGAIADYDEAIRLKPDDADAYCNRGNAKLNLGDQQGAITDYDEAIRLKPSYAEAYNKRGKAKLDLEDKQGAIADYDKAIRWNPDFVDAYFFRGLTKYGLDDQQGALADFDEAIRLDPDFANAYFARGIAKRNLEDEQGAVADYQEAARLYQQQGNTKWYRYVLNKIEQLER